MYILSNQLTNTHYAIIQGSNILSSVHFRHPLLGNGERLATLPFPFEFKSLAPFFNNPPAKLALEKSPNRLTPGEELVEADQYIGER